MSLLFFRLIDPSLGRVDKSTLPQQALMELLIEGFDSTGRLFTDDDSGIPDVSQWKGVTLDITSNVTTIQWSSMSLGGTIDLKWIPPAMIDLDVVINSLTGTLDLTQLPDQLEELWVSHNQFSGKISLTDLPASLLILDVSNNALTGTLDLTKLPDSIGELYLERNDFARETDFSKLPDSLEFFSVFDTHLSGTIVSKKNFDIERSNVVMKEM